MYWWQRPEYRWAFLFSQLKNGDWWGDSLRPGGMFRLEPQPQMEPQTMDYTKLTTEQLGGAIAVLEYLISITPCSGKAKLQAEVLAAEQALCVGESKAEVAAASKP